MKTACPRCGANVSFMPGTQKLYCEYCGSQIDVNEFDVDKLNEKKAVHFDEYTCSTCGAKLITDETTSITDCVYCGSRQIIKESFKGKFNPKALIPFNINRNQFVEIVTKRINKQILKSEDFLKSSKLMESKGVYVPYRIYTYDLTTYSRGQAEKVRDDTRYYNWFEMKVNHKIRIPQDSSKQLDDEMMRDVAPYDYSKLKNFDPLFLNGFLAEIGNESEEKLRKTIDEKILDETQKNIDGHLKGFYLKKGLMNVDINNETFIDILLPVWIANIKYKNKNMTVAVNGQTGKIAGNIPNTVFETMVKLLIVLIVLIFAVVLISFLLSSSETLAPLIPIIIVGGVLAFIGMFVAIFVLAFRDMSSRKEGMVSNPLAHKEPIEVLEERLEGIRNYKKSEYYNKFGGAELQGLNKMINRKRG